MEGGPPTFRQDCTCPALLMSSSFQHPYGTITLQGLPFLTVLVRIEEALGPVRVDYFWGTGDEAGELAGRMKQNGRVWLMLPKRD